MNESFSVDLSFEQSKLSDKILNRYFNLNEINPLQNTRPPHIIRSPLNHICKSHIRRPWVSRIFPFFEVFAVTDAR